MQRIDSEHDRMNDIVRFDLADGKAIAVTGHFYRHYGIAGVIEEVRASGGTLPSERVPVFWLGRQVGTLPPVFDPEASRSVFYTPRPGDLTKSARGMEAHHSLGQGDLSALPGFVWDDDPNKALRDVEGDRAVAVAALTNASQAA